jgi:hypothetical protein
MADLETERLWQSAFPGTTRPVLYVSGQEDEFGFKRLSDTQDFVTDVSQLSQMQLYARSANNQLALTQAQDEYIEISRRIAALKGKDPRAKKNPQKLMNSDEFEDRKEATLYGYKYEVPKPALLHNGIMGNRSAEEITDQEKRDVRLLPNPFEQGGFVPTERQYKAMLAKASDPKNIDSWTPVIKDGKQLIPRRNVERPEYTNVYVKRNIDDNGEVIRPVSSGTDEPVDSPGRQTRQSRQNPNNKPGETGELSRTRFQGNWTPFTGEKLDPNPSTPGKKRAAASAEPGREGTPGAKRRRPNGDDPTRPRHANQYTKAKEAAAAQVAKGLVNGAPMAPAAVPDLSAMTPLQLRARRWTDDELRSYLDHHYLWLHDDPETAKIWKLKVLGGSNPVRSWSMVKKWQEWKNGGKDKRPRKKVVAEDNEDEETQAVEPIAPVLGGLDMARVGSEGGSERGRKGVRALGALLNGPVSRSVGASVDRSATMTPSGQSGRRSNRQR